MKIPRFARFAPNTQTSAGSPPLKLEDGSRVAVMGGGPAGSLFSMFILEMAERAGLDLNVDIYEPRDFSLPGPQSCNMCAGIVSESLIQMLALEGINLPPAIVQRGMDSYMLHNEVGRVRLSTPNLEKRVGTIFRGAGPRGATESERRSFDGFLLERAVQRGANLLRARVDRVERVEDGKWLLKTRLLSPETYDFLAVATGVNTSALRLFMETDAGYHPPRLAQAYLREYFFGKEIIERTFGHTIHFFLLNLAGLDCAAVIPKGDSVTVCLLGKNLNPGLLTAFLKTPQVRSCMPPDWQPDECQCQCAPRINVAGSARPFADRIVFLGDSGVTRLYKDGIGAAYQAAKAAAAAAIFGGISEAALSRYYGRFTRRMVNDNVVGKLIFAAVGLMKPWRFASLAVLQMIVNEQTTKTKHRLLSGIIWDIFTGSASYSNIALRMFHPAFWGSFAWHLGSAAFRRK